MTKVQSAITMDIREFHPSRDLQLQGSSIGARTGSIPLRACNRTGQVMIDRDSDLKKITSFTDFACCFLRYAQTMSVFHPMSDKSSNVSDTGYVPGVSFYDLLAYWRRLYDSAVPLTVVGVLMYDRQYRDQLALKVSQRTVAMSDGFRTDVSPSIMAAALAQANHLAIMRGVSSSSLDFLKGRCHFGKDCNYSHDLSSRPAQRNTNPPYSRPSGNNGVQVNNSHSQASGQPTGSVGQRGGGEGAKYHGTVSDYQDGSGKPKMFPSSDVVRDDHRDLHRFLELVGRVIDDYELHIVLQNSIGEDGRLLPERAEEVAGLFDRATVESRRLVQQQFNVDLGTAAVGGALRPSLLQWLSDVAGDSDNDVELCGELNNGIIPFDDG
ncbi:hypothetical protein FOL47_009626 [Perkinsus chesapeaki]|uniref:C3H1-type domain-containing protein n=1 Tax=Perkinsus chesapeaki TaxID=330153 RepID=A0A7J6L744_PERCH|nr:hypothetical protein FOL47_009626 [Perkinsus chesapeaki]